MSTEVNLLQNWMHCYNKSWWQNWNWTRERMKKRCRLNNCNSIIRCSVVVLTSTWSGRKKDIVIPVCVCMWMCFCSFRLCIVYCTWTSRWCAVSRCGLNGCCCIMRLYTKVNKAGEKSSMPLDFQFKRCFLHALE